MSLTFQPSSFKHGPAQRFTLNSAFFLFIRGPKLGKTTLGAVLCFPEVLQCCSSAGQQLFGSSVALEYLRTEVGS